MENPLPIVCKQWLGQSWGEIIFMVTADALQRDKNYFCLLYYLIEVVYQLVLDY
jgi:hypothetical protein